MPEYALSQTEIEKFTNEGYLGPFTLFTPEEAETLWSDARPQLYDTEGAAYPGSMMNYDRHLDVPELNSVVNHREIVERVQSLLGNTVFCWRSEWFPKNPGDEGTDWHQVESFVEFEGGAKLVPCDPKKGRPVKDTWELSAWIALTDATVSNGCMRIIPGTHRTWYFDENMQLSYDPEKINNKMVDGKKSGFYGYDYQVTQTDLDWKPDESAAIDFEMKAGQFLLFTSRVLHGSYSNNSQQQRMGWAIRYTAGDIQVYPNMTSFRHFGETFPLDRHACLLVAGEDYAGVNRVVKPMETYKESAT